MAFAVVIAKLFGYEIPFSDETIITLSGAIATILGVINSVLTIITSKKIGLKGDADEL